MAKFYAVVEIEDNRDSGRGQWHNWQGNWNWNKVRGNGFVTADAQVNIRTVALINSETGERKDVT